jgi:hypothetical protein
VQDMCSCTYQHEEYRQKKAGRRTRGDGGVGARARVELHARRRLDGLPQQRLQPRELEPAPDSSPGECHSCQVKSMCWETYGDLHSMRIYEPHVIDHSHQGSAPLTPASAC